ncbi:hypothetical protein V8V91_15965 [Algoriphagus halophilus]|uniref:hypothetical protein n=1 Tax=Algoriphagus halophilus TaxID=226505 RepID=UPI00358FBD26
MKNLFVAACLLLLALQSCTTEEKNQPTAKKAIFVILDGIPEDVLDTVPTPNLDKIIAEGGITKATMGGEKDGYSQTPTISAVGYNTVLTGVWANKHNVWGILLKIRITITPLYLEYSRIQVLRKRRLFTLLGWTTEPNLQEMVSLKLEI